AIGIDLSLEDYLAHTKGLNRATLLSILLAAITGTILGLIVWRVRLNSVKHHGEKLEAVEAMTKAEERDQRLIRALGQIIYQHNLHDDVITWAGDCRKIVGFEVSDMPASTNEWLKRIHPDDIASVKKGFQLAVGSLDFY